MNPTQQFDVLIHGATVEGCAAAILYARRGVRVGLVSPRREMPAARYRRTLLLHRDVYPLLRQLGVIPQLEAANAAIPMALWSRAGWLDLSQIDGAPGFLVDADLFRAMLVQVARRTNGVTWIPETGIEHILFDQDVVKGVCLWDWRSREISRASARLTVAADGQHSTIARLLHLPLREYPQRRFQMQAVYRLPARPKLRTWLLDPDIAVAIPHANGTLQVIVAPVEAQLAAFQRDPQRTFARFVAALPEAPVLNESNRISPIMGPFFTPSTQRSARISGLALIGEASLRSDPLGGMNATRGLHEADWLVNSTLPALLATGKIDPALQRFERHRGRCISVELARSAELARGRRLNRAETLLLAAASHDDASLAQVADYIAYPLSSGSLVTREGLLRATWAGLTKHDSRRVAAPQT